MEYQIINYPKAKVIIKNDMDVIGKVTFNEKTGQIKVIEEDTGKEVIAHIGYAYIEEIKKV